MKPLYALVADVRALELMETDTELGLDELEAITNTLEGIRCDIQVKAAGVGAFVLNLEAYAEAAKDASKALSARAKRIQSRADHMREYLRLHMSVAGMKKIEADQFTLTRKANPPSVVIDPDTEVPDEYLQAPDPVIDSIVRAVAALDRSATEDREGFLVITPEELAWIIERHLPPRMPDKKKIADALKAAALVAFEAIKGGQEAPPPILPGCRLEQGERLEIKP